MSSSRSKDTGSIQCKSSSTNSKPPPSSAASRAAEFEALDQHGLELGFAIFGLERAGEIIVGQ